MITPAGTAEGGPCSIVDAPTLVARHVAKAYRRGPLWRRTRLRVLIDASIELHSGEIVGLVGENGSGKSTFMKILVGSLERDGGTVERIGRIGYCPQEPVLYERLTCDEHLELFGDAYGMGQIAMERSHAELYAVLDFARYSATRVEALSGGTRAKLNLALALLPDPQVLLLDEPYAGFDWDTYLRFWDLTSRRRAEGRSVLIISHFMADEERFDRIVVRHDGLAGAGVGMARRPRSRRGVHIPADHLAAAGIGPPARPGTRRARGRSRRASRRVDAEGRQPPSPRRGIIRSARIVPSTPTTSIVTGPSWFGISVATNPLPDPGRRKGTTSTDRPSASRTTT